VSPELPNKTFIKQVGRCEFKDLKEIKEAFSVQRLTKEFYEEIQTWFYHALKNYEKEIFFPGGQEGREPYPPYHKANVCVVHQTDETCPRKAF